MYLFTGKTNNIIGANIGKSTKNNSIKGSQDYYNVSGQIIIYKI